MAWDNKSGMMAHARETLEMLSLVLLQESVDRPAIILWICTLADIGEILPSSGAYYPTLS